MDKIDIRPIWSDHLATLQDNRSKRTSWTDRLLFFGIPVVGASIACWFKIGLTVNAVNGLLTAFAIFAGLLFNLLVMVMTFLQNTHGSPTDRMLITRKELLRQVSANLSFAVLSSIVIVAVAIFALASTEGAWIPRAATFLLLCGSLNFSLTLLMVLRRMYFLLLNDLERHKINDRVA